MRQKNVISKILLTITILTIGISIKINTDVNSLAETGEIDHVIKQSMEEVDSYEVVPKIDIKSEEYMAEGDKRYLLNNDPEPIFKANSEVESFFDINLRIDEDYLNSVGATVTIKEVMKYSNYLARFEEDISTAISPDCQVWVLQVYYPNGFESRRGIHHDAFVTGLYDAHTGYYHGYRVTCSSYEPFEIERSEDDYSEEEFKHMEEQKRLFAEEYVKYGYNEAAQQILEEAERLEAERHARFR